MEARNTVTKLYGGPATPLLASPRGHQGSLRAFRNRVGLSLPLPAHPPFRCPAPRAGLAPKLNPGRAPPLVASAGLATEKRAACAMVRAEVTLSGPPPPQSPGCGDSGPGAPSLGLAGRGRWDDAAATPHLPGATGRPRARVVQSSSVVRPGGRKSALRRARPGARLRAAGTPALLPAAALSLRVSLITRSVRERGLSVSQTLRSVRKTTSPFRTWAPAPRFRPPRKCSPLRQN